MSKDNWETPWDMIDVINKDYPIGLDVCTDGVNAKCSVYLTDSLDLPWKMFLPSDKYVWCNPPYSNVQPWVDKIIKSRLPTLLLVNASTSAKWFHDILNVASEMWVIRGRIAFIDPETGEPVNGNDRSQVLFIIDGRNKHCVVKSVDVNDLQPHRKTYGEYLIKRCSQ